MQSDRQQQEPIEATQEQLNVVSGRRRNPVPSGAGGCQISDDLIAPPDRRLNQQFDEVPTASGPQLDTRANFYVIAHVDFAASDLSRVQKALYSLADSARRTDGNLGFESLQEINHPNHFNLISA
jgi:hypothetical protein